MDLASVGRLVFFAGIGIAALGGLLILFSRVPVLKNLGKLPGDIRVETGNVTCFAPIVSMIILSILLSIAVNVIARLVSR
jgi:hypothetical protein